MPLSEQEQRLLDEMERSLYHSDADDVTSMTAPRGRASATAVAIGVLAVAAGIALLVVGVVVRQPLVGVLGFLAMFGGALFAVAPPRRFRLSPGQDADSGAERAGFMDTLNERWDRREDDER